MYTNRSCIFSPPPLDSQIKTPGLYLVRVHDMESIGILPDPFLALVPDSSRSSQAHLSVSP